ncbi:DUF2795 domain-containing protein [Nonomuraea ceibae]|uniref:DUF2795 domain-containing protein n=1 Tax=Nonomuraea ceibae TaxID=1935170 RepID=UPI001C5E1588|nr:DUF2795 domain-containing protein [Nonomuraea ceibae]
MTHSDLVRVALSGVDFPADKQSIVRQASELGAGEEALRLLSALPLATYANVQEVLRSIPRDPQQDDEVPADVQARQARDRSGEGRGRLAEHLREPRS